MKTRGATAAGLVAFLLCQAVVSQTLPAPTSSVSVSGSLVLPADEQTKTSAGGSFEFEHLFSRAFSVGATVGFWKGSSERPDFPDSAETYLGAVATFRRAFGRFRPFLQLGGGIYWLRLHFLSRNRFAPRD